MGKKGEGKEEWRVMGDNKPNIQYMLLGEYANIAPYRMARHSKNYKKGLGGWLRE